MAKSFSRPRILPQRGGLRLSDQQRKAATMWYNWYAGSGGGQGPETNAPLGEPSIEITGTKVVSSGSGTTDWHGRTAVEVKDGIVILVYRVCSAHNVNDDGFLAIRFSDDYGATWSDENKYLDGSSVTGFPWRPEVYEDTEDPGEPWMILCPNGDLLVFGWRVDFGVARGGTYFSRSTDGGKTWTTPAKVTFSGIPVDILTNYPDDTVFMTNHHFIVDGVIYASTWMQNATGWESGLLKSEDNGATWVFVSRIVDNSTENQDNSYEAGLCYVGNDKIISMMRNGLNSGTLYKVSTDMGQTWGALTDVSSWGVTARHRFYQRSLLKGKNNWWEDPVILTSVFRHGNPGSSQTRINAIQISKDFGQTFPYVLHLDDVFEDGGYNDMFYNPLTDEYVVVGYRGQLTSASIMQYNFKISWVETGYTFANTHKLDINASGEELRVPNNLLTYPSDGSGVDKPFSIEIWVETSTKYTQDGRFIALIDENATPILWSVHFFSDGGGINQYVWFKTVQTQTTVELRKRAALGSLTEGDLLHIVVTYDGSNTFGGIKIYQNGQEMSYQADNSTGSYSGMRAIVGNINWTVGYNPPNEVVGGFHRVRHFNEELSWSDVIALYNNGVASGLNVPLQNKCVQELLLNGNANADNIGVNGALVGTATFSLL